MGNGRGRNGWVGWNSAKGGTGGQREGWEEDRNLLSSHQSQWAWQVGKRHKETHACMIKDTKKEKFSWFLAAQCFITTQLKIFTCQNCSRETVLEHYYLIRTDISLVHHHVFHEQVCNNTRVCAIVYITHNITVSMLYQSVYKDFFCCFQTGGVIFKTKTEVTGR